MPPAWRPNLPERGWVMRFIIANEFYQQMLQMPDHTPDCYVRPGEYLHHMYIDGREVRRRPGRARLPRPGRGRRATQEAVAHLRLHKLHYEALLADARAMRQPRRRDAARRPAADRRGGGARRPATRTCRACPTRWEDLGLELPFLFDLTLRTIYTRGQITGGELADAMAVPFAVPQPGVPGDAQADRSSTSSASGATAATPASSTRSSRPRATAALQRRDGQDQLRRPGPGAVRRLRRER